MTDEIREKIFQPFFTTKTFEKGTGLGLPIVAEIVRAHGGEIEVTSAPKRGTTVVVSLPLCAALEPASDTPLARRQEEIGRYILE